MNESEARSKIKYRIEVARQIAGNGVDGKAYEDLEIALQVMKEIREYRAIGTVEEFKALKEKNVAKKPKKERWIYTQCVCGNVFSRLHKDYYYYVPYENKTKYCPKCGQRLDWE